MLKKKRKYLKTLEFLRVNFLYGVAHTDKCITSNDYIHLFFLSALISHMLLLFVFFYCLAGCIIVAASLLAGSVDVVVLVASYCCCSRPNCV